MVAEAYGVLNIADAVDFMYLRAILCTFQISVDFYYVPVGGMGGRGGGRGGAGRGGGIERGWYNVYCMGTVSVLTVNKF